MKCKQPRPDFELRSLYLFPTTITITPRVWRIAITSHVYIYIYIYAVCVCVWERERGEEEREREYAHEFEQIKQQKEELFFCEKDNHHYHHHQFALTARIFLILSYNPSQSSITPSWFFRLHLASACGKPLKLVDPLTYLGSKISSTECDIKIRLAKTWTGIDKLQMIKKSDISNEIK